MSRLFDEMMKTESDFSSEYLTGGKAWAAEFLNSIGFQTVRASIINGLRDLVFTNNL